MTTMKQKQRLARQAKQFQDQIRTKLNKMVGAGNRHYQGGGGASRANRDRLFANFMKNEGRMYPSLAAKRAAFNRKFGFRLDAGKSVTDQEVNEYIQQVLGGNPFSRKLKELSSRSSASQAPVLDVAQDQTTLANEEVEVNPLNAFLEDMQAKINEREEDDRAREAKILEERTALRDRVLGDIDQYGTRQRTLLGEEYADRENNVAADYAAVGLGNSTAPFAQQERVRRNRDLAQGDLEDRLADRRLRADIELTDALESFRERPTYVGPDMNMAIQLAQLAGQTDQNAYQEQFASLQEELAQMRQQMAQRQQQGGGRPVVSGGGGSFAAPIFMNGTPWAGMSNFLGNVNNQIAGGNARQEGYRQDAKRSRDRLKRRRKYENYKTDTAQKGVQAAAAIAGGGGLHSNLDAIKQAALAAQQGQTEYFDFFT